MRARGARPNSASTCFRSGARRRVTARERAALAWTEAVTQIATTHDVPDAVYEEVRRHFDEKALVDLTLAIVAINGWNRMNVAFRTAVGTYVSPHATAR